MANKGIVKLGIVGCGFAGTQTMYAPVMRLLEAGKITTVMDPDREALDFMMHRYGPFDCYTDYDCMLAEADIDAVIIASPVFFHERQTIRAAEAGKHILCEKPMAPTIEACDRMLEAAEDHGVKLMVGLVRRFDRSLRQALELVSEGELGKLVHIHSEVSWCHDNSPLDYNWRQSIQTLGGVFQDNGSHVVDLCEWWAGEVDSVSGEVMLARPDWEVETDAHAILKHKTGVISTIDISNTSHKPSTEYFLLEGTDAALEIQSGPEMKYCSPLPYRSYLWRQATQRADITVSSELNLDKQLEKNGMYKLQVDHFCDCILQGEEPAVSGVMGRKTVEIINAVYRSAWEGRTVSLPLNSSGELEQAFREMWERDIPTRTSSNPRVGFRELDGGR